MRSIISAIVSLGLVAVFGCVSTETHPKVVKNVNQPSLQIRLVAATGDNSDADLIMDPDTYQPLRVLKPVYLDNRDVSDAYQTTDNNGRPAVTLVFRKDGADKFTKLTSEHVGQRLAFMYYGKLMDAPRILSPVTGGSALLTWSGSGSGDAAHESQEIADFIRDVTH